MKMFIPTPTVSKFELGFLTIHFYALCILLGIAAALIIGKVRYQDRGGNAAEITDVAFFTIPIGIIGGRFYHVVTTPERYFGKGGSPLDSLKIWEGGLGIWGAAAFGTLAGYLAFRSRKRSQSFGVFADSFAPGILIAQGIGRFGNWFNGELFGRPTNLPWGLEIPLNQRPIGYLNFSTFHPTFLYEAIWCFAGAAIISNTKLLRIRATGDVFVSYIAIYCLGRTWIEALRIDPAHQIFGVRLNVWVSAVGFMVSLAYLLWPNRPSQAAKSANQPLV
jgi:prolipoprotein diacylglyceryl transferase